MKTTKISTRILSLMLVFAMLTSLLITTPASAVSRTAGEIEEMLFDEVWYASKYSDVVKVYGNSRNSLLTHWRNYGKAEGRSCSPFYDGKAYIALNADLKQAFGTDYTAAFNHFLTFGIAEGRTASSGGNIRVYANNYLDLVIEFNTDWPSYVQHYTKYGRNEGRVINRNINPAPSPAYISTNGGNVNVRSSPSTSASVVTKLANKTRVTVTAIADGGFGKILLNNGITGYVPLQNLVNQLSSSSSYDAKVNAFLADSRWKVGVSWGSNQTPKLSSHTSWGCCAYAWDFAQYVYNKGVTSGTKFTNASAIKSGDILYVTPQHWMIVLYRNGNTLDVLHGNWTNGKVCRGSYTLSGNTIGSSGKTFSYGYHFL